MLKKLISRKGIILVALPLFTIFLQIFIRLILNENLNTIGITLAALGLGQIFPFIYFDHLIFNKILSSNPSYADKEGTLQISYPLSMLEKADPENIEKIKNQFFLAILLSLSLYLITVWLGILGYIIFHIILGLICCVISWYLLIFK